MSMLDLLGVCRRRGSAPADEVPAVVRKQPVAVLAESGTRSLDAGGTREGIRGHVLHQDSPAARKGLERDLLDGAAREQGLESPVVDDATAARVQAVVPVEAARRDEVGSYR